MLGQARDHADRESAHLRSGAYPLDVKDIRVLFPRIRREIAALRLLRLPGVAQLRDEGIEEGRPFLVMDLVQGAPFPGAPAGGGDTATAATESAARARLQELQTGCAQLAAEAITSDAARMATFEPNVRHKIEEFGDILIAHAHTPDGTRHPHGLRIRRTVDVDIALHAVHLTKAIAAGFRP